MKYLATGGREDEKIMPDSNLGNRHECSDCGIKFYDLGKPKPTCPKCGTVQTSDGTETPTSKRSRKVAEKPSKDMPAEDKETPDDEIQDDADLDDDLDDEDLDDDDLDDENLDDDLDGLDEDLDDDDLDDDDDDLDDED